MQLHTDNTDKLMKQRDSPKVLLYNVDTVYPKNQ